MNAKELEFIQNQIGYNFHNPDLLQQAFIRRSYSNENGGENNEILEFIGDKVLDFIVVKLLTETYGFLLEECDDFDPNEEYNEFACDKTEAQLTQLKKKLVKQETLSQRIDELGISKFLIMGKGDCSNHVDRTPSVKEDLFEAILGAVTLDCNWNIAELQNVVDIMLNPESYLEESIEEDYISLIQDWTFRKYGMVPVYEYHNESFYMLTPSNCISEPYYLNNPFRYRIVCHLYLGKYKFFFRVYENSKLEARKKVCKFAYEYLGRNDLLFSIQDEIPNPNETEAITQLEILARRGYFSLPTYKFTESHNQNGNPVWTCTCRIPEESSIFHSKSTSKKEAKKNAAYKMLQHVLNTYT